MSSTNGNRMVFKMTELNDKQKIKVIKAILDEEIEMYTKACEHDDVPKINSNHELSALGVREDTLITLREKLKILKEFQ